MELLMQRRQEKKTQNNENTLDRYFQIWLMYGIHFIVIVLDKKQQLFTQKVMQRMSDNKNETVM